MQTNANKNANDRVGTGLQAGFTLMEMIVVLAIFLIVMTSIINIFVISSRAQNKINVILSAQANTRTVMESMIREVRMGSIDYTYSGYEGGIVNPTDTLALIDSDGNPLIFKKGTGTDCSNSVSSPCLIMGVDTNSDDIIDSWAPITGLDIKLNYLKFFISPVNDPFEFNSSDGTYSADAEPRVTISLEAQNIVKQVDEITIIPLQSTVSTRYYRR